MNWCQVSTQAEFDAALERREQRIELTTAITVDIRVPDLFSPWVKAAVGGLIRIFAGRVEAWGSSRVVARESSSVEAWESSRVEAWESSSVEAWESSRVEAWESSSVVAWGYVALAVRSSGVDAKASANCAVHVYDDAKCDGGVQIACKTPKTVDELCEYYGIDKASLPNEVEVLDKIRSIVLADGKRLDMGNWHGGEWDDDRKACDETECGTTHCLAGWAQVLCENPVVRKLDAEVAGAIVIPSAKHMFFTGNREAKEFLESREYANQ